MRARAAAVLLAAVLALSLLPAPMGAAAQTSEGADVTVSQVYGGGGNAGAPLTNDFVELHNRTGAPISLVGRSLQYASATGNGNLGANAAQLVALTGTIAPGGYHLIQLASGGTNGVALPTADDTGTINMSGSAGKVALVDGATGLGCNGGSTPCTDAQLARIIDLVGYGGANFFEGTAAAPTLSNTTAAFRKAAGAQDTNDNAADFETGAPAPRNSSTAGDPGPEGAAVTISEVYGGGGNANATFTNDFIELRNRTANAVDVSSWSVQYASTAGTSWQVIPLSGSLPANGYLLVQLASGGAVGAALPAPDVTGSTNMAAANGKVALLSSVTALSGACPVGEAIVDFVGYGTANCFEGAAAAPAGSNTTSPQRLLEGLQDTDDNSADFAVATPTPRNSGAAPGPDPDPDPDVDQCLVPDADRTRIHQIQGTGASTPIAGQQVVTRGIVTADFTSGGASGIPANQGSRGFYIEALAEDRDNDPQTSEGVFVFEEAGTFAGGIGNLVTVAGTAGERFGMTQIAATDVDICENANLTATLPAPAALPLPAAPSARDDVLEPLESMRVTAPELTVVEFFQLERFGEVRLSTGGIFDNPTNVVDPRDDDAYNAIVDFNAANNIILDNGATGQNLDPVPYVIPGGTLRIGDQLLDATTILNFGFGNWRLSPIDIAALTAEFPTNRTRPRPLTPPEVGGSLTVASYNVLNYFNGDGQGGGFPTARGAVNQAELDRQTEKLVAAVTQIDADIVGLIEMENDGGEFQATAAFVDALNAEYGEVVYDFVDTGVIGTDAIKQAFIYKPATVQLTGDHAILDRSVDDRFNDQRNRPVLAQTFTEIATGEAVTVAVNHFKSKGSSCGGAPDDDPRQGNCNGTRDLAAAAMVDWLKTDPTGGDDADAVGTLVIGDINAYAKEDPISTILAGGYVDMLEVFAPEDGPAPYSFTFDATQGRLDHALASDGLAPFVTGADEWHINADETQVIDYKGAVDGVSFNQRFRTARTAELYYQPGPFRSSDHDPVIIGLDLAGDPVEEVRCPGNSQGKGRSGDGCPGDSGGRGPGAAPVTPPVTPPGQNRPR